MKISKNLAGQIVNAIHEVCGCPINFINRNGIIIASTDT
ncbi:MAG: sugar diacid recognition domain-containing protein, partial [Planctomycetia bacterium]|nr:sugar diacid recognition domain-containing protein [Planctomycetia bacterium]